MLTKKVKNRSLFIFAFSTLTIVVVYFIIKTLNTNLLYFRTPSDIFQNENIKLNKSMRLGGMVKKNSIQTTSEGIKFIITDFKNEIIVNYSGTVPSLFQESKGVVAEGVLNDKKYFLAKRILAKHDENYMPPDLQKILEKNAK